MCRFTDPADSPVANRCRSASLPRNLDQVKLEFDGDPGCEFKSDVLVCKGAAIAASFRLKSDRCGFLNPLLGRECEAIETRLFSNPVEFDGVKVWVV